MKRAGCFVFIVFAVAVVWLSVFCVSSWWFHGLVCAHISLWKELVALFCFLYCVLAVVWLSVFCVSSWWFYGLVCPHISPCVKSWLLCFAFFVVFLLLCGCQCPAFLLSGSLRWPVHTSPCGKSWLLCFNCVVNCFLAVAWTSVLCVSS